MVKTLLKNKTRGHILLNTKTYKAIIIKTARCLCMDRQKNNKIEWRVQKQAFAHTDVCYMTEGSRHSWADDGILNKR